ncbi:hypothetical protein AALP_AAs52006U000300 [Arabis alpina]|uniref:BHLH domain-containing protein n=1 Tax=Arabis alpina TaxID=50452 RepID=A0A087FXP4_ARAAL|nr:hypothetical protein AALP_AAs52006U000300 [Arabis alpina]
MSLYSHTTKSTFLLHCVTSRSLLCHHGFTSTCNFFFVISSMINQTCSFSLNQFLNILFWFLVLCFMQLEQGMRPILRCYNPTMCSTTMGRNFFTGATTSDKLFSRSFLTVKLKMKTESKEVAAKKHSDAERRRRLRINSQFATLRTILPNLVKQDKASVLGETVRNFNELKKMVKEIPTTPALEDSLRLGHCNNRDMTRVVFSCSDREGLMTELSESMKTVNAKAVRAEIMTVGGRSKCALFIQGVNGNEGLIRLKKSLKHVVNGKSSAAKNNNNNGGSLLTKQ